MVMIMMIAQAARAEADGSDEFVALENMSVLQQSGFEVALEEDQQVGWRLRLVVQPMGKNTKFDIQGAPRALSYCLIRRLT